jgi:hypothetical protein
MAGGMGGGGSSHRAHFLGSKMLLDLILSHVQLKRLIGLYKYSLSEEGKVHESQLISFFKVIWVIRFDAFFASKPNIMIFSEYI